MDLDAIPGPSSASSTTETTEMDFITEFYLAGDGEDFFTPSETITSEVNPLQEDFQEPRPRPKFKPRILVNTGKSKQQESSQIPQGEMSIKSFEPDAKFKLKFEGCDHPEPILKFKDCHLMYFSNKPLRGSFDIIMRRRFYKDHPLFMREDNISRPFELVSVRGDVEYKSIIYPPGSHVLHSGATFTFNDAKEVSIIFNMVSSYMSHYEKHTLNMRMHTAKHMELRCLDSFTGSTLGVIYFQVMSIPRIRKEHQIEISYNDNNSVHIDKEDFLISPPTVHVVDQASVASSSLISELKEINNKLNSILALLQGNNS